MPYKSLNDDRILETIALLHERIEFRFPDSGLGKVCQELKLISKNTKEHIPVLMQPNIGLRVGVGFLSALIIAGLVVAVAQFRLVTASVGLAEFVQFLESSINDIVLTGAAIWFLVSLEQRFKRNKALKHIHELRAIAHVIDMHQLTKAPELVLGGELARKRDKAPRDAKDLLLYLDYCSEMLSLTSKVAVLYVQNSGDSQTREAVNEVEALTAALSRKIWQKMMFVRSGEPWGEVEGGR